MTTNLILVGPLVSGKTTIASKLIEKGFCKESNFHSIEKSRREHSSGTYSGEMFAWADFLQKVEEPASNDNNIYEFSGTGRNVWNISQAINLAKEKENSKWLIVYVLADEEVLMDRVQTKVYDAPCPYPMTNPRSSIQFMNQELKKTLDNSREWAGSPKIVVRSDMKSVEEAADQIIKVVEELK